MKRKKESYNSQPGIEKVEPWLKRVVMSQGFNRWATRIALIILVLSLLVFVGGIRFDLDATQQYFLEKAAESTNRYGTIR